MTEEAREPEKKQEIPPAEEEPEEQEEQEAEASEEEEEIGEPHPVDRIVEVIEEIVNQERRLAHRNAGNLKYELVNNIYPLLRTAFAAMVDYIDATEGEKEDEMREQVQEEVARSAHIAIENCKKILKIHGEFGEPIKEILSDELKPDYDEVVEWANTLVEQTKQIQH